MTRKAAQQNLIEPPDSPTLTPDSAQALTVAPAVVEGAGNLPVRGSGEGSDLVLVLERLAINPDVPVDKMERIYAMLDREHRRQAEIAFNAAMAETQQEIGPVTADASNPQTRSKYATYEAIDRVIRPIYSKHGFALSFNTGKSGEDSVEVLCDVTHGGGHAKLYRIDMPADGKGAKGGDVMTKTHATGSAVSYGRRYLLKMIFNIAEVDDDGNAAGGGKPKPLTPDGYEDFVIALEVAAAKGTTALDQAWRGGDEKLRLYIGRHDAQAYAALRKRAAESGR